MTIHHYGLISDTHGSVHREVHRLLGGVETIFHAGDVGGDHVLSELETIAPVHAISGNVDQVSDLLPVRRTLELPLGRVGMAHGHLYPNDRVKRIEGLCAAWSQNPVRILLFGHTHLPHFERRQGCWVLNPGSCGPPRFDIGPSVCILEWDSDRDLLNFHFRQFTWSR